MTFLQYTIGTVNGWPRYIMWHTGKTKEQKLWQHKYPQKPGSKPGGANWPPHQDNIQHHDSHQKVLN
jgi:hypothetical protein